MDEFDYRLLIVEANIVFITQKTFIDAAEQAVYLEGGHQGPK